MNKKKIENNQSTLFDKLYFCFFLLLPFVYFEKLIDPVLIPRQIFLTLFVFIVGSVVCYQIYAEKLIADFSFLKLPVFILSFLFIATIILSFFQSIAISESIYVVSKVAIEILFFIITTYLIIQKKLNVTLLIKSVLAFSLVIIAIAIFQMIKLSVSGNNFWEGMFEINSTCANKNLLASLLFLTFPFILHSTVLQKPWKFISTILAILGLAIIWLIRTRAVIIATFVFILILVFLSVKNKKIAGKKHFIKAIYFSLTALILIAGSIGFQNKEKFSHIFDTQSTFDRLVIWENSAKMIQENFVFGVGAGNWQIHYPKFGLGKFKEIEYQNMTTTYQRPHNDFLWEFCEMGIAGMLTYISIFIIVLYYSFKLFRNDEKYKWLYAAFIATIIGYLLIAFVDFPLERIEHQILLFLIFSIISAHFYAAFSVSDESKKMILKLPFLFILIFVPVCFSFAVAFKRGTGEYHTKKMYYYHHKADWNQMIREADKAYSYCYSMDPMSAPLEWYKGVALYSLGNLNVAKMSFEKAYTINPYNVHVINNLASCYEELKDHTKAEELYLSALAISPQFEEARLNLSAVYYNIKEFKKAFATIDKVNIASSEPKYKMFLPVILDSYMNWFSNQQKDERLKKLMDANTSQTKLQLYYESKQLDVNFIDYFLKKAK